MSTPLFRGTPIHNEPKRKNRFMLEFPSELGIEAWMVKTSGRPSVEQKSVEIPYLNTSFFVLGRYIAKPMDIEFLDHIGPSTSQKVMDWQRLHSEMLTGRQGYAASYKKDLFLYDLDPTGVPIAKWGMYQCMITAFESGENDHSNDELQTFKISIQPDIVELLF